jgi:hypothetical protein
MKTFFLLVELLTDRHAIRNILHACFSTALVSVAVLFLLGTFQVLRHACLGRNTGTPSGA